MNKMTVSLEIDPLNYYGLVPAIRLVDACGLIPGWVGNEAFSDQDMKTALDKQYGYGLHEMTGSTITEEGVHSYPEDPDMYPLIKMERKDETLFMYESAIVAIRQADGTMFVTRMD